MEYVHDRKIRREGVQVQLKASSLIFVAVRDLSIIVSGKTRQRCKALGFEGMRFKWDRDR